MRKEEVERWKSTDFLGFPNYIVSNFGNVRSLKRNKKLKPHKLRSGYTNHILYNEGKSKSFLTHRLVALAFIPNPEYKPQINHIDGIKNNNVSSNLEWVTKSENQLHAYRTGLQKHTSMVGMNINHPKMSKAVLQFDLEGNLINIFPSAQEASRKTGVDRSTISRYLTNNKRRKHAGGYNWQFADEVTE